VWIEIEGRRMEGGLVVKKTVVDASDERTFSKWLLTSLIFRSMLSIYRFSLGP